MFWNQVAMVVCLVGILVAKFMIFWQLYSQTKLIVRILREQVVQHVQHDLTHTRLDKGTHHITEEVKRVPDQVIQKITDNPSAGDGDIPRSPLPFPLP
jgi:hypothetical protein